VNGPWCTCCAHVIGRAPSPARFEWTGLNMAISLLCGSCCEHWQRNAAQDPNLVPVSIKELEGVNSEPATEGQEQPDPGTEQQQPQERQEPGPPRNRQIKQPGRNR